MYTIMLPVSQRAASRQTLVRRASLLPTHRPSRSFSAHGLRPLSTVFSSMRSGTAIHSFTGLSTTVVRSKDFGSTANVSTSLDPAAPLPRKILIANRGEIACRVMRTCRAMGIATVAVYSDVDADALFVRMADEAVRLGPAPSNESYLLMDKVIAATHQTGAEMIHPGYGFLSENAEFAERVTNAGLTFMGPPAEAIRAMGSKSASKVLMTEAQVPCVPGYHGTNQDPNYLLLEARKIGWPVLIKPTAGGGGKGMKVAWSETEFPSLVASAQREAHSGFGDSRVLLERWLPRPRHVEVQVIADAQGNVIHLGSRDCSTQRRHQKVLEEAPAPGLDSDLLDRLGQTAVRAAEAACYKAAAGTVEFLLDATNPQDFFFCEMNTRLQVEHPVTEAITGLDLVAVQIHVAAGRPLPMTQQQVTANMAGHAFEARLYAEHPRAGYLPSSGKLIKLDLPANTYNGPEPSSIGRVGAPLPPLLRVGAGVRVDSGVQEGDDVSVHYDPMISKLIVMGSDRDDALRHLQHALSQCIIVGPHNNLGFLRRLAAHPALTRAQVETAFLDKYGGELMPPLDGQVVPIDAAVAAAAWRWRQSTTLNDVHAPWSTNSVVGFRNSVQTNAQTTTYFDPVRRTQAKVTITPLPENGMVQVLVDHAGIEQVQRIVKIERESASNQNHLRIISSPSSTEPGQILAAHVISIPQTPEQAGEEGRKLVVVLPHLKGDDAQVELIVRSPDWVDKSAQTTSVGGSGTLASPMPSRMVEVFVKPGDEVAEGDALVVLEAMKTEHVLRAPRAGVVRSVSAAGKGELVPQGAAMVVLAPDEE